MKPSIERILWGILWAGCVALLVILFVTALGGCVNPQFHLHVGERHEHQSAQGCIGEADGETDELENDPRWESLNE